MNIYCIVFFINFIGNICFTISRRIRIFIFYNSFTIIFNKKRMK